MARNKQHRHYQDAFSRCLKVLEDVEDEVDNVSEAICKHITDLQGVVDGTIPPPETLVINEMKGNMATELKNQFNVIWDLGGFKIDILDSVSAQRRACTRIRSSKKVDKDVLEVIQWFEDILKTLEKQWD